MSRIIDQQNLQQYSNLEFLAHQVVEGFITGLHKSPFHGFSVEFAEHRLYNSGESTKHIDWKLYGRTEKLFVKKYEEETNLRCQLVLDVSSSMYYPDIDNPGIDKPDKITFSVYAIAAIMNILKKQRDAVGLSFFDDQIRLHTDARSNSLHHKYLIQNLEEFIDSGKGLFRNTSATKALHEIAEKIHKRSLVIIFSDMIETGKNMDDLFSALQHLRHNKHEVILFHVHDRKSELDFRFDNRPYKFVDVESGKELKVNPLEVRDHYIKKTEELFNSIRLKCGQYRIEFVDADINQGFKQILLPYLVKRGKLF